jgi:hypothetical protein
MHALNALPAAELAPLADVLLAVVVVDFVPHPARAMAATEATATIFIDDLKALSFYMHHIPEMHQMAHFL